VRHLNDGALRRLYDEPLALEEETRAHYKDCAECQRRFGVIADDARQTAALLAVPGATVDAEAALRQVKSRPMGAPPRLRLPALPTLQRLGWRKPAAAGLVAAALVATLAFTPLAQTVQQVFEPTTVQPVTVNEADMQGLNVFSGWADVKQGGNTSLKEAATAQEASQQSGLPALQVKSGLPAKFAGAPVSYGSVGQFSGTAVFTDKAPSKLHGTTMTVQAGPGQAIVYGDVNRAMTAGKQAKTPQDAASAVGPMLTVIEMRAPKVTTSGASEADIKQALLDQNGLSPTVRQAIKSFDDPKGTLPLPIPADYATSETITNAVHGMPATFVGDNTGLGAALIWVTSDSTSNTHVVYAVAGLGVDRNDLLAVANGVVTG
jgi:hypothetical protein